MSKADIIAKDFLNIMDIQQKNNTIDDPMEIGKITSISPLIVEVEGLPLYEGNLYINKYLLDWDETVDIITSANGTDSHTHTITNIHHPSKLQIGYYVGLYGVEWNSVGKTYQKYHLIDVIN